MDIINKLFGGSTMAKKQSETKLLVWDMGNYNNNTNINDVIFRSVYTTEKQPNDIGENIIIYDGVSYYMEKGELETNYNKTKKNYMPFLLYAIEKSFKDELEEGEDLVIDLFMGLPIAYINLKSDLKEQLSNKTFEYSYKTGDDIKIRKFKINQVGVMAEGISSYYSLSKDDRNKDIMIVDMGGNTTNVVTFVNNKVEIKDTITNGITDFYHKVKERENSKGEKYTVEIIERLIEKEIITDIEDIKESFINEIVRQIKAKFNPCIYDVKFTGGGMIVLEDKAKEVFKEVWNVNAKLLPNALTSNVEGNVKVAKKVWGYK